MNIMLKDRHYGFFGSMVNYLDQSAREPKQSGWQTKTSAPFNTLRASKKCCLKYSLTSAPPFTLREVNRAVNRAKNQLS